jgi:hypothetical protein
MWRWTYLALAVVAFSGGLGSGLGHAQERPSMDTVLRAAALTEADVPAGLALDPNRSGPRPREDGWPSYTASFVTNGRGDMSLMGVINVLGQDPDATTGIDRLADEFRTGLPGNRTELPAPAVGDASRAFTVLTPVMGGAMTASTAFVAIRRADVVAGVAVTSIGDTPRSDVAIRLAQEVDRRLRAALSPGS